MSGNKELLIDELSKLGLALDDEKLDKLNGYMEAVLEKNKDINLTRITDPADFIKGNIVDSLSVSRLRELKSAGKIMDMGTGAGIPGLILAIAYPEKEFVLADSVGKKLKVTGDIAESLGIDNVSFLHGRAEDIGQDASHRERYDLILSRAVADLTVLSELTLPLVRKGGALVTYKGARAREEAGEALSAIKILGGAPPVILDAGVEGTEHKLVVVKKVKKTPSKYPRKAGDPSRKPLR